jgi:hypothetical protein
MVDPMLKARNAIGSLIGTVRIDPRRSRGRTTWRDQIAMATEPAHHGLRAELETTCQNRQPTEVDNWRERERECVCVCVDASLLTKKMAGSLPT